MRGLLATEFDTVFLVNDKESLRRGASKLQPTVLIVDLSIARGDFEGLVRKLRRLSPSSKLIALTVYDLPEAAEAILIAGADAVVLKSSIGQDLLKAIDTIMNDVSFVSHEIGQVPAAHQNVVS